MKSVWVFFFSIFFLVSCGNQDEPNSKGNVLWEKTYGESGDAWIKGLVLTSDGGALIGGGIKPSRTEPVEIYLLRVDGNGNTRWEETYGAAYGQRLHSLVLTPDGGALLGGSKSSNYGSSSSDMYLLRVDEQGNKLWEKTYGKPGYDAVKSLALTSDGGALLLGGLTVSNDSRGMYLVRVDELGEKLWEKVYDSVKLDKINSLVMTPDGGAMLGGTTELNSKNGISIYLAHIDENGDKLWEKIYNRSDFDESNSIALTPDGGILLGGVTVPSDNYRFDMYLLRVDERGKKLWDKTYGGSKADRINSVVLTPDDGALLGGYTKSNSKSGSNMYLVRVDEHGNMIWDKTYSRSRLDKMNNIVITPDGGAMLGGTTESNSESGRNIYLVRIE